MSRIEDLRKTAAEVAESVADSLHRDLEIALRNELTEKLTIPEQTREEIYTAAMKIAREHECRETPCRCGEQIALDLEYERLR